MTVLFQIAALFILMGIGFFLGKTHIIESAAIKGLSALIVKATLPALIIMSLQKPFTPELLTESLETLFVASLYYISVISVAFLVMKTFPLSPQKKGVFIFALSFSNAGFIGYPVVTSILGTEALFLTSIHNIIFNLLAFSAGIFIISYRHKDGSKNYTLKKTDIRSNSSGTHNVIMKILNINVIASCFGFFLFIYSLKIPLFFTIPLNMLGGLTTPLAMITTGLMLSRIKVYQFLGDWSVYFVTLLRLLVWPLITAVILHIFQIEGQLFAITVIISAMPAASNTSLIAEVYGGDSDTASSIVFISTLFSVISIPFLAILL